MRRTCGCGSPPTRSFPPVFTPPPSSPRYHLLRVSRHPSPQSHSRPLGLGVGPGSSGLPKDTLPHPVVQPMNTNISPKEFCWKTKRKLKIDSRKCKDINTEEILHPT
ncbi:unnamed protein product [Pipistrellus nathusii]|uniref:Uncharacterized protein n=1 Tax=Pipistrellus nathusii TaxID=59473 RepID=A0ABP0A7S6_PIPNA